MSHEEVAFQMFAAFERSSVLYMLAHDQKLQLAREAADHHRPQGKHRWRFEVGGQVFRTKKAYVESKEIQQDKMVQNNRELRARCEKLQRVSAEAVATD